MNQSSSEAFSPSLSSVPSDVSSSGQLCNAESSPKCPTCHLDEEPRGNVYALGRIDVRFPRLSIEKEFAQVVGRTDATGLTDRQTLHDILVKRENRYLLRQLCFVFSVEGIETYLLHPKDPADFDLLIDAIRPSPRPSDVDVVIGTLGPIAPTEMCNGLLLPIVIFEQLYSFDIDSLIKSIPRPSKTMKGFESTAEEVFSRIQQLADNSGATDQHRALNYLCVRYKEIYSTTAHAHARNCALTSIETRPSRLSGARSVIDVIFCYTNRQTDVVEKFFTRVDITEQFPFLVSKMTQYFDR